METQTMKATNLKLKEFFVHQLRDIYWAEKKLFSALPKLQEAATTPELKDAFGQNRKLAQSHVDRLEQVFGMVNEKVDTGKCAAIADIVNEGADVIEETNKGSVQRDTGLIFAGKKAEHYKIATYGAMINLAKNIGYRQAADILDVTLTEDKAADALLTRIAENNINYALN
ncbi:YciE/YciF ferroxidase family protein [Mucilaginibacter sp.]